MWCTHSTVPAIKEAFNRRLFTFIRVTTCSILYVEQGCSVHTSIQKFTRMLDWGNFDSPGNNKSTALIPVGLGLISQRLNTSQLPMRLPGPAFLRYQGPCSQRSASCRKAPPPRAALQSASRPRQALLRHVTRPGGPLPARRGWLTLPGPASRSGLAGGGGWEGDGSGHRAGLSARTCSLPGATSGPSPRCGSGSLDPAPSGDRCLGGGRWRRPGLAVLFASRLGPGQPDNCAKKEAESVRDGGSRAWSPPSPPAWPTGTPPALVSCLTARVLPRNSPPLLSWHRRSVSPPSFPRRLSTGAGRCQTRRRLLRPASRVWASVGLWSPPSRPTTPTTPSFQPTPFLLWPRGHSLTRLHSPSVGLLRNFLLPPFVRSTSFTVLTYFFAFLFVFLSNFFFLPSSFSLSPLLLLFASSFNPSIELFTLSYFSLTHIPPHLPLSIQEKEILLFLKRHQKHLWEDCMS